MRPQVDVLVLGGSGMLGKEVVAQLVRSGISYEAPTSAQLDITRTDGVAHYLSQVVPKVVLNCAGLIPIRSPVPIESLLTNALAPWGLAWLCEQFGSRLVHISTDCVFNGRLGTGFSYSVNHSPDARDLYGRTKAMGEPDDAVVIRTSFVGWEHGLLEWLMRQGHGDELPGWRHAYWSGGTVFQVARELVTIAQSPPPNGIYHVATSTPITKYDVLATIVDALGLPYTVTKQPTPHINRALQPTHKLPVFYEGVHELITRYPYTHNRLHSSRAR